MELERSTAGVDHHHHRSAITLPWNSSTSPSLLLDQEGRDHHRAVRVLNAEVSSVRHYIGTGREMDRKMVRASDREMVHGTDRGMDRWTVRGTVRGADRGT